MTRFNDLGSRPSRQRQTRASINAAMIVSLADSRPHSSLRVVERDE